MVEEKTKVVFSSLLVKHFSKGLTGLVSTTLKRTIPK